MKQKIINVILLLMVLLSIVISLLHITSFEVTEGTYIGIIITLLSIATTLVIGYQIYNSIELKKEIIEQKQRYDAILSKNAEMESKYKEQSYQMQEGFDMLSAIINYNKGQSFVVCGEAFYPMHRALVSSIETNRTDYEWVFQFLRLYISEFDRQTFCVNVAKHSGSKWYINTPGEDLGKPLQEIVDRYMKPIKEDENLIRSSSNFCKVQFEYNRVMKLFYKRMDDIVRDPITPLTSEEKDKIIGDLITVPLKSQSVL